MSTIPPLPEDVRRLIVSDLARGDAPAAARAEVLRALELSLGVALAPPAAFASVAPGVAGSKMGLLAKLSLAAALGGGAIGGVWLQHSAPATLPPAMASATPSRGSAVSTTAHAAPPPAEAPLEAAPVPSATAAASIKRAPRTAPEDNLAEERRLLAQARSALQQGELSQANAALQEHALRFGAARLSEERDRLLVQVAVQSGDSRRARAEAESFLRRYPKSVYAPGILRSLDANK